MTIPPMHAGQTHRLNPLDNRFTQAIASRGRLLLILVALLYVITFNGRWRIGLDSANYRGLALNLASGRGYVFGDWAPRHIYPGLPYVLAAVERLLGPQDRTPSPDEQNRLLGPSLATTASVLLILASAWAMLFFIYRLISLHYARWVALVVTCGVGANAVFLKHAHEILTDVPFGLGVTMSLYGWDLLRRAASRRAAGKAISILAVGLAIAASMRPTFLVLAGAWILVCLGGLIVGPRRFYAICLTILLAIWAALIAVDPRLKEFNPLAGGYEREAIDLMPQAVSRLGQSLYYVLHDQLPAAVFGEQLAPFSILGSLIVLGSTLMLLRRHPLWTLLVWGTFFTTLLLSSQPRYYLATLPVMLLGWLLLFCNLASRMRGPWSEVILLCGMAIVLLNNLSASVKFVIEQRRTDFVQHYRDGDFLPAIEMSRIIIQHARPDQRILAPSGSVMSFLSGRRVYTQRELLPGGIGLHNPRQVAAARLDYVVGPARLYRSKEPLLARLMDRRIIRPRKVVARGPGGMYLATVSVTIPSGDWRKLPKGWRPSETSVSRAAVKKSTATRPATRQATTRHIESRIRKKRPRTQRSSQSLRAMTTMLSPDLLAARGPLLSGLWLYGAAARISDSASFKWRTGSPPVFLSFLRPKYILATGPSRPSFFNRPTARSFRLSGVGVLPYEKLRWTLKPCLPRSSVRFSIENR